MGKFKEALDWFRQKVISEERIARETNNALIQELQIRYETAQKEQKILAQELALERGVRQRNWVLIIFTLLLGLTASVVFAFRKRLYYQATIAQQESKLQQQHIQELQNQNKLLSLSAMIAGQEAERKRLAQDIHDDLGGLLATVKIQFDRVGELLNDDKVKSEFQRARNLLDDTSHEIRRIAHNMMPHALMKMGLIPALEDLAGNIQSANGLRVSLKCIDITTQLSDEKEVVVYRIAQELCNNVIRHAEANKLLIQLSQHNGTLSLVVEDNGKGFADTPGLTYGLGIESVSSRVAFLNGSMDIDSSSEKGTSVTIEFPVNS
jgi:signal transduction histidine kinase